MEAHVVVVIGTRPEAIKLLPLYKALKSADIPTLLCASFQHTTLLTQVFDLFQEVPDINLDIMQDNQDLFFLTSSVLNKMKSVFSQIKPALVLVQGDTTTAFAAALAAFYLQIPIGHVEAGLRSGDKYSPFPEEINRSFISKMAALHFAPTAMSAANLLAEGIDRDAIFCTGNTIVDALAWVKRQLLESKICVNSFLALKIDTCKKENNKIVLLTTHRRESFDGGIVRVLTSIKKFALSHADVFIFYPVHPNPHVMAAIDATGLKDIDNIILLPPLLYHELVYLLISCDWVITDSGGIQEEAVSLGKRVLVIRDVTERPEGIWEGMLTLVGTSEKNINRFMTDFYHQATPLAQERSTYGDGWACERIVKVLQNKFSVEKAAIFESIIQHSVRNDTI
jgi:UDP-N-acetylglucosamine 2-epimerase (non-hydrolysing)